MRVNQTFDKEKLYTENELYFTFTVENKGLLTAKNIEVRDTLPSAYGYISSTSGSYDQNTHVWTITIDSLSKDEYRTFKVKAEAEAIGNPTNVVWATSDTPDWDSTNNIDIITPFNCDTTLNTPQIHEKGKGSTSISFEWTPVERAASYKVSIDGGETWIDPSLGATSTIHKVDGLDPGEMVTILVKGIRNFPCQVYGNEIKDIGVVIYNQYGKKIYEIRNINSGWDGTFKGKMQPSGVYIAIPM